MSDRPRSVASGALGILWIVVGGLLTLFSGGCALFGIGLAIMGGLDVATLATVVIPMCLGLLIAWGGVVILRHGIHRLKG